MKAQKALSLVGIGAIAWFLLKEFGNGIIDQLGLRIQATAFRPRLTDATVDLEIQFTNNSGLPITVNGFTGFLVLSGKAVSSVTVSEQATIQSGSSKIIRAQSVIPYAGLASNIIAIISDGNFLPSLRLVGRLGVNDLSFNINKNIISIG